MLNYNNTTTKSTKKAILAPAFLSIVLRRRGIVVDSVDALARASTASPNEERYKYKGMVIIIYTHYTFRTKVFLII